MKFMIKAELTRSIDDELKSLIKEEIPIAENLMKQGILKAAYNAADGSGGWLVMKGPNQEAIQEIMEAFPLYKYLKIKITPLA